MRNHECGTPATPGNFTYRGPPAISAVSPDSGNPDGGTCLTIEGKQFHNTVEVTFRGDELKDGSGLCIGTAECPFAVNNSATPNTIKCEAPRTHRGQAGTVSLEVRNTDDNQLSNTWLFDYQYVPEVTSFSPEQGSKAVKTEIIVKGNNIYTKATVLIGNDEDPAKRQICDVSKLTNINSTNTNVPKVWLYCTTRTISGTAPSGKQLLWVTNSGGGTVSYNGFTYLTPPTVTSANPQYLGMSGGETVTLTGTGFDGSTDGSVVNPAVTFGGVPCNHPTDSAQQTLNRAKWLSATSLECKAPAAPAASTPSSSRTTPRSSPAHSPTA